MPKRRGHGEGSIYRRKDGRWVAELHLGTDKDGKKQVWRHYAKLRRECADELARVLERRRRGERIGTEKQTVGEYLDAWLSGHRQAIAGNTYTTYEQKIRIYLKPALGDLTLGELTPQHVQAALDQMSRQGRAPRTVAAARAVLRAALAQALTWGTITRNAGALARSPKLPRTVVRPLSPTDARKILDAAEGHALEAFFCVAMALGLRPGEALGLRWADVDLERRELRVVMNLQRAGGAFVLVEPKTQSGTRVVALPAFAVASLRSHRVRQLEQRLAAGDRWETSDLVFTSRRGAPLHREWVAKQWHLLLENAGIPRIRLYDLRHTCASLLAAHGLSLKEISALLGHSTITITANVYTHLLPGSRAAADAMDAILPQEDMRPHLTGN